MQDSILAMTPFFFTPLNSPSVIAIATQELHLVKSVWYLVEIFNCGHTMLGDSFLALTKKASQSIIGPQLLIEKLSGGLYEYWKLKWSPCGIKSGVAILHF